MIKLDQILTIGQSSKNGLDYTGVASIVATTSKIVFVKAIAKIENTLISGKNSNALLSEGKKKGFLPICHYCNKPGHIHPRCFKYRNTFRMNRMVKNVNKPRTAPKHRIDLKNKFVKKIWIKKIRFKLLCCLYFFKSSLY